MKKITLIIFIVVLAVAGYVSFKKNIGTINIPQKEIPTETPIGNSDDGVTDPLIASLEIPDGFSLSVFAKDLPGARVIEIDPKGRLLISQTKEGKISILGDTDGKPGIELQKILVSGLKNPHGMAFKCDTLNKCNLYIAESNQLSRFDYDADLVTATNKTKLTDINYSSTDNHFTRTLLFLPSPSEHVLLVSVGSSCNVCHEKDEHRARILSYDTKTGKLETYARGLRNSVFMTLSPVDGKVWATEMGRDSLGDNIPPDEINIIKKDANYGWPICYGKNIHDDNFDKNTYIRNPCMEPFETPSHVDLQAHSAPLGLSFVSEEGWPEDMWYNLLVAYHGSWNRSEPTGYKIVRIKLDEKGNYLGTEDFITGWLTKDGKKIGRPVDIKVLPSGTAYISDDLAGVIYKLSRD